MPRLTGLGSMAGSYWVHVVCAGGSRAGLRMKLMNVVLSLIMNRRLVPTSRRNPQIFFTKKTWTRFDSY